MIAIFELCCGNGIASKISINGKVARCERFRPGENVMSQEVKEFHTKVPLELTSIKFDTVSNYKRLNSRNRIQNVGKR